MINSMTGYGDAQLEEAGISFLVEVKTLNNRFLKTTVKLPDSLAFAEPEVDRIIRHKLARGSVTFVLHMRYTGDVGAFDINSAMLERYLAALRQVASLHDQNHSMTIDLANILQMPGVCQLRTFTEQEQEQMLVKLKALAETALNGLCRMRAEEGKSLMADFEQQLEVIRNQVAALSGLTERVIDNYRKRIQQRSDAMLSEVSLTVDQDQLLKEVALFAERSDINEEISRLLSHTEQFHDVCHREEQAGRRLDFLAQEMLREANTIASKANDSEISHHVVEIKVAIDRLKEQVQNVE